MQTVLAFTAVGDSGPIISLDRKYRRP
jgi:hypothetical protein